MLASIVIGVGAAQAPAQSDRRIVRVRAERFAFSPAEIVVAEGETVELRIKSDDTVHGFHIAGTSTDVEVPKRGKGEIVVLFAGTVPGRYDFECNRMCGAGHDFMRGSIVVKAKPAAEGNR
jgi:cytochrome c oxidase subunit 2